MSLFIAVVPAEGTIVELDFKKISAEEVHRTSSVRNQTKRKVLKMQNLLPRT
jgi:hypothetical protein